MIMANNGKLPKPRRGMNPANTAPRILTPGHILTPEENNSVFVFSAGRKEPVYVGELPFIRFRSFSICIATHDKAKVPEAMACRHKVSRILHELTGISGGGIIQL